MTQVVFLTHPDVRIDPAVPVPQWGLSERGQARIHAMLDRPWLRGVGTVWSSPEKKAIDGAAIIAQSLNVPHHTLEELGENDRSATGYLDKAAFEATADQFFAQPSTSVRGWERAVDAQARIVAAVDTILATHAGAGDLVIVGHGGIGALLLCHLKTCPISRQEDQPPTNGGNYFMFDAASRVLHHGWRSIDD